MSERKPVVIWEDPPPSARTRPHPFEPELLALRERPGEWGRIATRADKAQAYRIAHGIRTSKRVQRLGRFDAIARYLEDGDHGVWARYLGRDGEAKR